MTSNPVFTSLLRAGSSSSRTTVPTLWHPTYYLRHFCKAGRPVRETQGRLRDARPIIYITSGRQVAQFAGDSIHFVTPDLLFTPLRGGGLPTSRETAPTSCRPTVFYVTSGRRVAQFARDRAKVVPHDLLFASLLRAGSRLLSASSPLPSAFTFSLESFKYIGGQVTFSPEPSLPCSSGRLLPPCLLYTSDAADE